MYLKIFLACFAAVVGIMAGLAVSSIFFAAVAALLKYIVDRLS